MKKLILFIFLCSFQINGQNIDLEKTINLIITEITPSNFKYINLADENLIVKEFDYSIQNYEKREIFIKDSLFPIELITTPKEEEKSINWKTFKLNNCKIYSKNDCINLVRKSGYLIEVKNKSEYDSIINLNIPNTIVVIINPKWGKQKTTLEIRKATEKIENVEKNIQDQSYFSFSIPVFSENKKYFRIAIYKGKENNGEGSSKIFKIENETLTEVFEYNGWKTEVYSVN
ncbi:hypothetical protein SGQ83_05395 [Flavobacterium sp. Fl-318]|uniref:Uncharacterized protein n=1 Tax=Flavobacterium cupriresistens TaxID=2893885 RepID=A0ABU4RBG3_9FLAO|nr:MULTISPECIES: hypothetical protein [unclassified Flavobacterium]MDX6188775.1 hypothetical protein [Flavobacterium sp. Fl-318]UFH44439.1 hypothetical protein LNP23_09505 [Flavobacterium sp. F-323]